jgi:hypothetical protein
VSALPWQRLAPGEVLGDYVLLRPLGRSASGNYAWWACCAACGEERAVPASQIRQRVRAGGHPCCRTCHGLRRRAPAEAWVCRWCGRSTAGGNVVRECSACERRAFRNGRGEDGRPRYRLALPVGCARCGAPVARRAGHAVSYCPDPCRAEARAERDRERHREAREARRVRGSG